MFRILKSKGHGSHFLKYDSFTPRRSDQVRSFFAPSSPVTPSNEVRIRVPQKTNVSTFFLERKII